MTQQKVKPIPPTYQNRPWSNRLLKELSAPELRRLIAVYGATQINARVAMNAAKKGVK